MNANLSHDDEPAGQPVDVTGDFPEIQDREIRNGRRVFLKLHRGDLVTYTTERGKHGVYEVVSMYREEIMYGVYRGTSRLMAELRPIGGGKSFSVERGKVYVAAQVDRSI